MLLQANQAVDGLRAVKCFSLLPYLFALIAAGLLPFKRPRPYRGVSLALALLWAWLAVAAWEPDSPFWGGLAGLGFLLFLGLAIWGKFEYGARSGPWAVTGTVLLVYSLLAFPLLDRASEILGKSALAVQLSKWFERPAFCAPLPIILFTCGILFFALEPTVAIAFVVPLVWALLGGPGAAPGRVELTELQVALVTAAIFLLQAPEVRRGDARRSPGAGYLFANRHRQIFNYALWALVMATLLCFFLPPGIPPPTIIVHLALLSALGIAIWLLFGAWQSLWFRAAAWWMARALGRIWVWFGYAWQWGILLLAAAALWAILPFPREMVVPKPSAASNQAVASQQPVAAKPAVPSTSAHARRRAVQLFAAVTLLWLAYQAYRGRTRLVIEPFAGYTNDEKPDKLVAGLGPMLQSELAGISDLFKVIDEATPSRRSIFIEVIPGVQDVGTILKDASAINLGPLKIPANLLVGLVGKMVSGPRLSGALHKVDDGFILTAALSGGGRSGNWRVEANSLERPRPSQQAKIQELVLQLAFRVATDLVDIGSPRWRAIRAFTDGLRAYRETQRQQGDKAATLREAERCLIRALNYDQQFRQCHFNLGVVYRQLAEHKSAQSAFRRALKEDPDNFEACYALAEAFASSEDYKRALWFSEAAIGINPNDARAWDLSGSARRYKEQEQRRHKLALSHPHRQLRWRGLPRSHDEEEWRRLKMALPHGDPAWEKIGEPSEIAVALAWRALCRSALGGPSAVLRRDRTTALLCTRNLAVTLARASRFPRSLELFRQAAWIAPHDPALRLYEGRTLFWYGRKDATKALRGILPDGLDPDDQALLWSVVAQAQARSGADAEDRDYGRLAHVHVLDVTAAAQADDLPKIVNLSLETPPDRLQGGRR